MTHPDYNRTNFPQFVCHHSHWDIYANDQGHCAAIPNATGEAVGCRASHFGDAAYVRVTLGAEAAQALRALGF